jgi:dTDP-4-amino-4,6-dideoxygalactose transaminase
MNSPIPFNRPYLTGFEKDYVASAIEKRGLSGDHHYTLACNEKLRNLLGVKHAQLTTSCTAALEMAAILCNLNPGDEVIVPSYTFVSTVNAFVLRGARPVFVDIRADTLNIDESKIEAAVTKRTKAIFVVHYAGVACEMDTIMEIAKRHGILVVEDAAQAIFSTYHGRALGGIGDIAALSFHETKNIVCGEGGAVLTNRPDFGERCEIVREKGTNRSKFFRGQVDKYTWVDVGSSYLPPDFVAAFLLAQLENHEKIQRERKRVFDRYAKGLAELVDAGLVRRQHCPDHCVANQHIFCLLTDNLETRTALISSLKSKGISAVFHYVSLHSSPMGMQYGYKQGDLPVTEAVSDQLVRLPLFSDLQDAEVDRVIDAVKDFFKK